MLSFNISCKNFKKYIYKINIIRRLGLVFLLVIFVYPLFATGYFIIIYARSTAFICSSYIYYYILLLSLKKKINYFSIIKIRKLQKNVVNGYRI